MPDYPVLSFADAAAWEPWLKEHHATAPGVWLRLAKKASAHRTVTYPEALDIALCYGWIDGQIKPGKATTWLRKFTPRRARSLWSKRNRDHAERLIAAGSMQPAGGLEVERAKADGRWEGAYDAPRAMALPPDFLKALAADKKAKTFFATLNRANVYAIAWRLQTARKPETRTRRLAALLAMLHRGEKFH